MNRRRVLNWDGRIEEDVNTWLIEAAYAEAAKKKHGYDYVFWARTNDDGEVEVSQALKIVETVQDERREVAYQNIIGQSPNAKMGGYVLKRITAVEPEEAAMKGIQALSGLQNVQIDLT